MPMKVNCNNHEFFVQPTADGRTQVSTTIQLFFNFENQLGKDHSVKAAFAAIFEDPFEKNQEFAEKILRRFLQVARKTHGMHREHREMASTRQIKQGRAIIRMQGKSPKGDRINFVASCPEFVVRSREGKRVGTIEELDYDTILMKSGLGSLLRLFESK